jgi:ribonucleoside-diphosphate reductase alpha chain
MRERLPDTRVGVTHKFVIHGETERLKGFITLNRYADGRPGEVFVTVKPYGDDAQGYVNAFAVCVSWMLQEGISLEAIVGKFSFWHFGVSGWTGNKEIPHARSVIDYVARWVEGQCAESMAHGAEGRRV